MSHLNRNVDFSMRSFAVVLNFVARNCWPSQYHYMEKSQPVNWDHRIAMMGSWLAGLVGSHAIATLIFVEFKRHAENSANQTRSAHVIGPLEIEVTRFLASCWILMGNLCLVC